MVDPSKDYYERRLAAHQNSWAQLSAAATAYHNPAAQHYMQQARLNPFFNPGAAAAAAAAAAVAQQQQPNFKDHQSHYDGGQGTSGQYPAGHSMHFPGLDFHRPLPSPAHANKQPLPAHIGGASAAGTTPKDLPPPPPSNPPPPTSASGPMPAHMRSYQPPNYHNLNPAYHPPVSHPTHNPYLPPPTPNYSTAPDPKRHDAAAAMPNGGAAAGHQASHYTAGIYGNYGRPTPVPNTAPEDFSANREHRKKADQPNGLNYGKLQQPPSSYLPSSYYGSNYNYNYSYDQQRAHPPPPSPAADVVQPRGPTIDAGARVAATHASSYPDNFQHHRTAERQPSGGERRHHDSSYSQAYNLTPPQPTTAAQPPPAAQPKQLPYAHDNLAHSVASQLPHQGYSQYGHQYNPAVSYQNIAAVDPAVSQVVKAAVPTKEQQPQQPVYKPSELPAKRKFSVGSDQKPPAEPSAKKPKDDSSVDPYAFDEESAGPPSATSVEYARFGSNGRLNAGPVYKFKSALLSREQQQSNTPSPDPFQRDPSKVLAPLVPLTSKSVPLNFRSVGSDFFDECGRFIDDLLTKPVSISTKPSIDTWKTAMNAKAEKKAEKKKAKELRKELAVEKAAALEAAKLALNEDTVMEEQKPTPATDVDPENAPLIRKKTPVKKASPKASPKKDSPSKRGRKPKMELKTEPKSEVKEQQEDDLQKVQNSSNNNEVQKVKEETKPPVKRGTLWAMPIVPKPPQKPAEKRILAGIKNKMDITNKISEKLAASGAALKGVSMSLDTPLNSGAVSSGNAASAGAPLADVWRRAFGAVKPPIKKSASVPKTVVRRGLDNAKCSAAKKSYLDLPPEIRRKPRPSFGGLIHFSPDWQKADIRHRETCRIPKSLATGMSLSTPQILNTKEPSSKLTSLSSYLGNPDAHSPPNKSLDSSEDKPSSYEKNYPYLKIKSTGDDEKPVSGSSNAVNKILINRKKLRMGRLGRMFQEPFKKEKKGTRVADRVLTEGGEMGIGLMTTPGLPELTESNYEALMSTANFGNFRRQTLLHYLANIGDSTDLKARLLDWKPEVFETKTRRQSNQVKAETCYRDIFGIDLPGSSSSAPGTPVKRGRKPKSAAGKSPAKKSKANESSPEPSPVKIEIRKSKSAGGKPTVNTKVVKKEVAPTKEKVGKAATKEKTTPVKEKAKEPARELSILERELLKEPKKETKPVPASVEVPVKQPFKPTTSAPETSKGTTPVVKPPILDKPKRGRKSKKQLKLEAEMAAKAADSDDDYVVTAADEKLQADLQNYALDLLETNPSWEKRTIIQNLVIWEPVDPIPIAGAVQPGVAMTPTDPLWQRTGFAPIVQPPPPPAKPGRKKSKKKRSGLDFIKKRSGGASSREVSRAGSPAPESSGPVREVQHSLDHVINESRHWVINKSAGETILHRAAKAGLPDIAAYALCMARMSPVVKDNAGIPPIHKAAFHGHQKIVEFLLKFGSDPNFNVKGTRPLHEAIEGGSLDAVYSLLTYGSDPLLYDYSGNMPIDIAEGNDVMHKYLKSLLADLHGKSSKRWNVNVPAFTRPIDNQVVIENLDDSLIEDSFEISAQPLPANYKIIGTDGHFVVAADLKKFTNTDFVKSTKYEIQFLSKEEFTKSVVCCLLGHKPNVNTAANSDGKILMVKVNADLKKLMGVNYVPTSPSKKKSKEETS